MHKIRPFLWYDDKAEEAATFYVAVFGADSKILSVSQTSVAFVLRGLEFLALNGGPHFTFSPAVSFFVDCQTQAEVDELWERLAEGGEKSRCGWLKDKYGLSWQIVPTVLGEMLGDDDDAKSDRVMQAMLKMDKLDIAKLRQAYEEA